MTRSDAATVGGAPAVWPAWGAAIVFLGFVLGCSDPGADVPNEPDPATTADIPRIPNLSELDPGFATAVRDALSIVDRDPSNGAAIGALGRLYQAHRYVDQARHCYERAEKLDPSSPDWPYYLGFLAASRGAHDEAARRFERALELRPSYWAARVRLGNVLLAAGDADGSEEAFRAVRAASPGTPWGELGLGKAARRRGQPETAAEHLRTALALDPAHRETRYLLAMTERQLGNPERAEELLADLADAEVSSLDDPMLEAVFELVRDTQTMIRTANQRLAEGDYLAADRLYREVLRLDPDSYDAHLNLGVLLGLADRNQEAATALERAIAIDPDRADAYALLTIAYIRTGRAEEGLRQLEKALEIDPNHPRAREILQNLSGN
ncbi:MAG: tetratricopeptide repeat protein [Holophagales bacterium]|nr:tetratricopeptide repeat protein [Holophagales bacterium]MXX60529.1 tetratricopeptide repeat protein [Holophagales bacterium]MYC08582.1 tetratricopeptide repeat protein [Holophagales bacterium]MYD23564.1 tetratricopeptide repeat protein [Holophagales bacterium]MYI31368.1 tetratricopeptide repeat protein [Holophagales bacterium]